MKAHSRALRVVLAATLTLGLTGVGLGVASSAWASTDFPSSSPVTPIAGHEVDTGTLVLTFDASQAGLEVAVTTPDPADSTAISTQTGTIGADGSVSIRDFAGPAAVYEKGADGQVHELGGAPLPGSVAHRQAASIYRGQTMTYSYAADTDTFTYTSGASPVPPSAHDVLSQIPITHFTVTSTDPVQGQSVLLTFSDVSPNGVGDPDYANTVQNYVYGAPDSLGGSMFWHGQYYVLVSARYSFGVHTVASFDKYGRLVAKTQVGDATPPVAPAGSSAAAHPLDTGTVVIETENIMPGTVFTSTVADPTKPGTSSVVSATVGFGRLVVLTNFAGYARIDVGPTSGDSNLNPATFRADVNIYRAQTVFYGYPSVSNTSNDPYGMSGPPPAPVIPATAEEAESLTPVATANVSPASWQAGSDVTLAYSQVTPTSIVPNDTLTVDNYVYSAPTALGSSSIPLMNLPDGGGYAYSFTVPGAYTSSGHVAASFDQFGRLVTIDRLDGETAAAGSGSTPPPSPTTDPAQSPAAAAGTPTTAALANTGQSDTVSIGLLAITLFGIGASILAVSHLRRRAASTTARRTATGLGSRIRPHR